MEFDAAQKVKGMIEAAEALDTGIRRNVYTLNAWLDACVRYVGKFGDFGNSCLGDESQLRMK